MALDADGRCQLGQLGDGPGTVMVRSDRLSLGSSDEGVAATVVSVARRAGRPVAGLSVVGLEVRMPVDRGGGVQPGDEVSLVVPDDAVVPLEG